MTDKLNAITAINPAQLRQLPQLNDTVPEEESSFKSIFSQAMAEIESANEAVHNDGVALALGNLDNIAGAQINMLKAEALTQVTVQVATRAVNAYKEIMQMQI